MESCQQMKNGWVKLYLTFVTTTLKPISISSSPLMLQPLNRETAGLKQTRPVKVIQFGDGNFMRGFMDWIIDILNEKTDFDGSVLLIRPLRKGKDAKKFEQDGLYHVAQRGLLNGKTVSETRLITCVNQALNPYLD